ncbi:MAG: SDR family NAD(P)-dependent oxidoreductase [Alphaproteobacteria bacterium]|nr:SDR family NAD(P)-dependent oxidoreductase [Alphaproteobacteria bacterium]
MAARLSGKVAVVTGAARGIGRAVAERYAAEGAQIVAISRSVGGLEELDDAIRRAGGAPSVLVPLDLGELDRIDPLGPQLYQRFGRVDILVGNAALLGSLGPIGHHDPKLWDEVFRVNVHANWRLIRTLEPLLRRAEAGRAIFVTSGAATRAMAYWSAYCASKAALDQMVRVWAAELAETPVRANLLSPGATRTTMRANAFPGEDPQTLKPPEALAELFVELALPGCRRHGETVTWQG